MSKYGVVIPLAGSVYFIVEAESEEEAKDAAMDLDPTLSDEIVWQTYRKLVSGNCIHFEVNEIDAEEL